MITVSAAKHIRRRLEEPDGGTSLAKANALLAEANRLLDRVKEDRARMKAIQKPKVPGVSRDERRRIEDSREDAGKAAAMERAKDFSGLPRCEVWDGKGLRCLHTATDADHVLGGSRKPDMEQIGGEGFQSMCRAHHDLKTTNTPTGKFWLDQAMEHALRVGAKRLVPHLDRALAKYEGKHRRSA
jgi:hypothetical protein